MPIHGVQLCLAHLHPFIRRQNAAVYIHTHVHRAYIHTGMAISKKRKEKTHNKRNSLDGNRVCRGQYHRCNRFQ